MALQVCGCRSLAERVWLDLDTGNPCQPLRGQLAVEYANCLVMQCFHQGVTLLLDL